LLIAAVVVLTRWIVDVGGEGFRADAVGVAVIVAGGVGVEADGGVAVIHPEKLVEAGHARRRDCVRVDHVGEGAADIGEAEIGVVRRAVIAVRPEADGGAGIVQPGHLGLHGAGKILVRVISLPVGRGKRVALVRMPGVAAAEIPGDHASIIDAEQLVEGRVVVVVEGLEV